MPQVSGSFVGKTSSQSMITLHDVPDHEMSLIAVTGPQSSADPLWDSATVVYWGVADLIAGNGPQTGYFSNRHRNGDIDRGTFEGRITTAAGIATMEGRWTYTGGTGSFAGITGGGTYQGRITSPTEVQTSWEGSYQLA